MALTLGIAQSQFETAWSKRYGNDQVRKSALARYRDVLAGALGVSRDDPRAHQLWPAFAAVWLTLQGPDQLAHVPAPDGLGFPTDDLLDWMRERGIAPMLYVAPSGPRWSNWDEWIAGAHDGWIEGFARSAAAWASNPNSSGNDVHGRPKSSHVIVRFAHEVNGDWFPWSNGKNGNRPGTYKRAFHHFSSHARAIAPNLSFFYCPMGVNNASLTASLPDVDRDDCQYVGFDWYSNDSTGHASMRAGFGPLVDRLVGASDRPIIVGETGVQKDLPLAQRIAWLTGVGWRGNGAPGGYDWIAANWSRVRGICYFEASPMYQIDYGTPAMAALASVALAHPERLPLPPRPALPAPGRR